MQECLTNMAKLYDSIPEGRMDVTLRNAVPEVKPLLFEREHV